MAEKNSHWPEEFQGDDMAYDQISPSKLTKVRNFLHDLGYDVVPPDSDLQVGDEYLASGIRWSPVMEATKNEIDRYISRRPRAKKTLKTEKSLKDEGDLLLKFFTTPAGSWKGFLHED